jgi:hypothetical protein
VADGVGEFTEPAAVVAVGEFAELAPAAGVGFTVDWVVHPAIDNEAITTRTIVINNFFSIHVSPLDGKMNQKRKTEPMKLKIRYP